MAKLINKFNNNKRIQQIANWIEEDNPDRIQEIRIQSKINPNYAYSEFINIMPVDDLNSGLIQDATLIYLLVDNYTLIGKTYLLQSLYSEITGEVAPDKKQFKKDVIQKI